jgi:hypothetical protein
MSHDPPIALDAPSRPPGSGRRHHRPGRSRAIVAVALLVAATGCGRTSPPTPSSAPTPTPASATPASAAAAAEPDLDGLLVATGGPLLVTDDQGGLIAFDPTADVVSSVTASTGIIVALDESGLATVLDATAPAPTWTALDLPAGPPAAVRLVALAPSGSQLAIVAGVPQAASFTLTIGDVPTGVSRVIPVQRGLNGPPSWLGPGTIAVDVIRDPGHSGIATIDLGNGALTDRPGPGSIVVSSTNQAHLAIDDPATGDVLLGDVATWQSGALWSMIGIHGPPATGVDSLAMSADGTRLAVVRRSDTGASVEIVVRVGDEWRTVRTLTKLGDEPPSAAWLE